MHWEKVSPCCCQDGRNPQTADEALFILEPGCAILTQVACDPPGVRRLRWGKHFDSGFAPPFLQFPLAIADLVVVNPRL